MPKKAFTGSTLAERVAASQVVFVLEVPKDSPEGTTGKNITFELAKCNPDMVTMLALHGASQKIGDSYAGAKDSGEDPIAYAEAAINDTIKQLYEGKWSVTRTGGGAPRTSILVQAYSRVAGVSIEEAQELVGQLNDEEKKAVSEKKKIVAAMAAIRAEAAVERARKAAEEASKEDAAA